MLILFKNADSDARTGPPIEFLMIGSNILFFYKRQWNCQSTQNVKKIDGFESPSKIDGFRETNWTYANGASGERKNRPLDKVWTISYYS